MLKRIVIALGFTVAATLAFSFLFLLARLAPTGEAIDASRLLLAALGVAISAYLFRRHRRWPQALLLACASALLAAASFDLFVSVGMTRELFSAGFMGFLFHGCLVNPMVWWTRCALMTLGWCFPFPLVVHAFDVFAPASNQAMQR